LKKDVAPESKSDKKSKTSTEDSKNKRGSKGRVTPIHISQSYPSLVTHVDSAPIAISGRRASVGADTPIKTPSKRKSIDDSTDGESLTQPPSAAISEMDSHEQECATFISGYNNDVLRAMVTIFRHADRTPKQKVKFNSSDPRLLALFQGTTNEVKLKKRSALMQLLAIVVKIVEDEKKKTAR